jgi:hypothetical protein
MADELVRIQMATTTTCTSSVENRDPDDDPPMREPRTILLLTTLSKASGENETDDDDDQRVFCGSMTTTLTEARGDQENDPEDVDASWKPGFGSLFPFAYRFAETVAGDVPNLEYDDSSQLHHLNGRTVIDSLREIVKS